MRIPISPIRIKKSGNRTTLDGKLPSFPAFNYIGSDTFTKVGRLTKHQHKGCYEFCLIVRGHVTWTAQERSYDLRGGDIYFTRPGEIHGGFQELMHPCTIYWMLLKVPRPKTKAAKNFLNLPTQEALMICREIDNIAERKLIGAQKLQPYFHDIMKQLSTQTLLGVLHARALTQQMLATLITLSQTQDADEFMPPGIERARTFLDQSPNPWPTIEELASLANMSSSHFHATFLNQIGMAPMDYAHRKRLIKARELFGNSQASVTSVAMDLGYCSSQHLATCFKRHLGITPTQAKKMHPDKT